MYEVKNHRIECTQHQYARDEIFRRIADMIGDGVLTRHDVLQQRLQYRHVSGMVLRSVIAGWARMESHRRAHHREVVAPEGSISHQHGEENHAQRPCIHLYGHTCVRAIAT